MARIGRSQASIIKISSLKLHLNLIKAPMDDYLRVKIKRVDKDLPMPAYQTTGSVAVDLYARVETVINPGEISLVPSNVIVQTPPGYFFLVTNRSSTPMKKGLVMPHAFGVIDQDFCGEKDEIKLQFLNPTNRPIIVTRGERLAQGLFVKINKAEWLEVDQMQTESRGGFGSTSS